MCASIGRTVPAPRRGPVERRASRGPRRARDFRLPAESVIRAFAVPVNPLGAGGQAVTDRGIVMAEEMLGAGRRTLRGEPSGA